MYLIPMSFEPGRYALMIVLQDDNIQQFRELEPFEYNMEDIPEAFREMQLMSIVVCYLPEESREEFQKHLADSNILAAARLTVRKWKTGPDNYVFGTRSNGKDLG